MHNLGSNFAQHPAVVLLIDDQPMVAEAIRRMLEGENNIRFHYCSDPAQAIPTALEVSPTVILQDLVMPEIDGIMVVRFFRSHPSTRQIPMIVLSTKEDPKLKAEAFGVGANDYLVKIPDRMELIARIRYHSKAYVNYCLAEERTAQLALANEEISKLNARLKQENLRLNAELDVARKLQKMILPKEVELAKINQLDIDGFMESASEVGGDYYDIWQTNEMVWIGIGDVTGHGLESGVLMLMVQSTVRTIAALNERHPVQFLQALNKVIYDNVQRMNSDRNLSFMLLTHEKNKLLISGQHEEVIVVRNSGKVELIDSIDYGFPIGLEERIEHFLQCHEIELAPGEVVVLYTDGVIEAENMKGEHYGMARLCGIIQDNCHLTAEKIRQSVIADLKSYIGKQQVFDDITLIVLKQP